MDARSHLALLCFCHRLCECGPGALGRQDVRQEVFQAENVVSAAQGKLRQHVLQAENVVSGTH